MNKLHKMALVSVLALVPWQVMADDAPQAAPAQDHAGMEKMHDKYWKKLDPNGTGFITKQAWMANAEKRFKDIDTNGDGKISKDEMKAFHEKMREHHHEWREHHLKDHAGDHDAGHTPDAPAPDEGK